jgi:hypothetical protein
MKWRARVLAVFDGRQMPPKTIAAQLKISESIVHRVLDSLLTEGKVQKSKTGRFSAVDDEATQDVSVDQFQAHTDVDDAHLIAAAASNLTDLRSKRGRSVDSMRSEGALSSKNSVNALNSASNLFFRPRNSRVSTSAAETEPEFAKSLIQTIQNPIVATSTLKPTPKPDYEFPSSQDFETTRKRKQSVAELPNAKKLRK